MAMHAARWVGFAVWAAVAASAAFWALRLLAPATPVPAHAVGVAGAQPLRGDLARVLGGAAEDAPEGPVITAAPSRFQLLGVVSPPSPRAAAEGLALIAVDGKPARAYRVGAVIEGELVLQRVRARGADLGARDAPTPAVALQIAPLPPAATGTLPSAVTPRPLFPPRPPTQLPTQIPTQPPPAVTALPVEPVQPPEPDDNESDQDTPPTLETSPTRLPRHGNQTM